MDKKNMRRIHACISGRVQGVFYRASTYEKALSLGLKGWVKNLPDGRVELVAEGPHDKIEELLKWCKQGPPGARVTNIEVEMEEPSRDFTGFSIRY